MEDKYVNKAYAEVTESAANTLTFHEIQTGLAMFEKVAWVIHRIQWVPSPATYQEMLANGDRFRMALTGNNNMIGLDLGDQSVYDFCEIFGMVDGTPATGFIITNPIIRDFSNLPGKGIIVPPRPLFVAILGTGLAAAGSAACRIEFTHQKLKADEYWELVEATRIVE